MRRKKIAHRIKDEIQQKWCPKCQRWKFLNSFSKGSHSDGLQGWCKKCHNKRKQEIKDQCFEHYGDYVCAHCGTVDKEVLTLDHINDDGARTCRIILNIDKHRQRTGSRLYVWLVKNNFPSEHKLQVL